MTFYKLRVFTEFAVFTIAHSFLKYRQEHQ